jgi:K+-transporting ATPase ATPase C chain
MNEAIKHLIRELRHSVTSTIVFGVLCCAIYPALVWLPAVLIWPDQANGSLIVSGGKVVGSRLIGQGFSGAQYFQPRPSDAGAGYDPTSSGGSNLSATQQKWMSGVAAAAVAYRTENGLSPTAEVPQDAVTASGSGLDPDISVDNAALQVARVAQARHLSPDQVTALVAKNTQGRDLGIFGEPRVNVLTLNLDLDAAK